MPIEIVIPHVDGSVPGYEESFREHTGSWAPCHVRDLGELRYVLRSIERFAPWARRVTLVVQDDAHVPDWLDSAHLRVVRHREFLPAELLPTFHWATIAAHLYRVDGISERFVIWEDDQMLGRPLAPADLFRSDGLPRISLTWPMWSALTRVFTSTYQLNLARTTEVLALHGGAGASFLYPHMPLPVSKRVWGEMFEALRAAPAFMDTVTRKSRGDERVRPTIDPLVMFANWVELVERRRWSATAYTSFLLGMLGRGAVHALPGPLRRRLPLRSASYGLVNDPVRTRRRMARLAAESPTFINVNDEAYDSWLVDGVDFHTAEQPNPESLHLFHATMEALYPKRSRFELAPAPSPEWRRIGTTLPSVWSGDRP